MGLSSTNSLNLILDSVDELHVSLDATSIKTYTSMRIKHVFNSIINSLEEISRFKQLKCSLKPRVIVLYAVTKLNMFQRPLTTRTLRKTSWRK
jgi:wyosine [tRNA(Phe)-imidazoG37] synthetase (radical SAM superfamily)